jgi:hypothetical protein
MLGNQTESANPGPFAPTASANATARGPTENYLFTTLTLNLNQANGPVIGHAELGQNCVAVRGDFRVVFGVVSLNWSASNPSQELALFKSNGSATKQIAQGGSTMNWTWGAESVNASERLVFFVQALGPVGEWRGPVTIKFALLYVGAKPDIVGFGTCTYG